MLEKILEKKSLYMRLHAKPDADIRHFTGFASFTLLLAVFKTLKPLAEKMYTW